MQVKIYANLRDVTGAARIDVPLEPPATVRAVLRRLSDAYPALQPKLWHDGGGLAGHVTVLLNGRGVEYLPAGLDTPIGPDDTLALFPPIGGG